MANYDWKELSLFPSRFKMQDSAGIRNALDEALIEENSYTNLIN